MFKENLGAFFNEFAVAAIWQGNSVPVIFDKAYAEQYGMAGNNPIITAPESSFTGIARNQTILVNSTNYTVQSYEPDGTGLILIQLQKA